MQKDSIAALHQYMYWDSLVQEACLSSLTRVQRNPPSKVIKEVASWCVEHAQGLYYYYYYCVTCVFPLQQVVESRSAAEVYLSSGTLNSTTDVGRPGVPHWSDGGRVTSYWHRPASNQQNGQHSIKKIFCQKEYFPTGKNLWGEGGVGGCHDATSLRAFSQSLQVCWVFY